MNYVFEFRMLIQTIPMTSKERSEAAYWNKGVVWRKIRFVSLSIFITI